MRRYRNKKTGAVVEVHGEVKGRNWEPVEDTLYSPGPAADPFEDVFPEEPVEDALYSPGPAADPFEDVFPEEPVEAVPKPKASRKGRK